MIHLPNKILIKKQTILKLNLDLSLISYLFRKNLNQRFNKDEKQHKNKDSNVKYFYIYSRNRLSYLFSTDGNSSITTTYTYKTIPYFYEFFAKVYLVDRDENQSIRYVVDENENTLIIEIINDDDDIESITISVPFWDGDTKEYVYSNGFNSKGYRLVYFEPIILRFNKKDALTNFWFFAN